MIYLDNAATGGFKPDCVKNAVLAALKVCAVPARSGHRLSAALSERVFATRSLLNELFHGYGAERVTFTKNCTEALNLALCGVLEAGDHAVTTALEHNSVLRPLHALKERGVSYSVAPLTEGVLQPEAVAALVTNKTKLVAVTSASNVTGQCPELNKLRALLPERVLLVVDGAQGAGHVALDMQKTRIDALAISGHKGLHGIQGAGALLFSPRFNPRPLLFGSTESESPCLEMPAFYPDRLESGTLSYPAIAALFEGALLAKEHRAEHAGKLTLLTQAIIEALQKMPRYRVYSSPNPCGIVAFRHEALASEEAASLLFARFHIAVCGGLHCAPLVHEQLNTAPAGLVRASLSAFQNMREVHALIAALKVI